MKPRKILVVDDSKTMWKVYELMLREYPVVCIADGRQAFDRLREHPDIDLVLFDIRMPSMTALEFLEALRRDVAEPPPTVVISTEGREEDTARALEAGAKAYIKKPFHAEELLDVIARLEERPLPE